MKYQVGVDIFKMERMARVLKENNPAYFQSVFTPEEMQAVNEYANVCTYFSTRFALKEAAFKALNTCWTEEMEWNQISTSGAHEQSPQVTYIGAMGCAAQEIGVKKVSASLSSDGGLAFAVVITEIS